MSLKKHYFFARYAAFVCLSVVVLSGCNFGLFGGSSKVASNKSAHGSGCFFSSDCQSGLVCSHAGICLNADESAPSKNPQQEPKPEKPEEPEEIDDGSCHPACQESEFCQTGQCLPRGGSLEGQSCQAPGSLITNYTVSEYFGVSHPLQVIEFDLPSSLRSDCDFYLERTSDHIPVVSQVLSGHKIAVLTDLPVGGTRSWNLVAGLAPNGLTSSSEPVQVKESQGQIEITNGITGVRLTKTIRDQAAIQQNIPLKNVTHPLAPFQGIRYQDGSWTALGPNYLDDSLKVFYESLNCQLKFQQNPGAVDCPAPMPAPKDFAPLEDIQITYLEKGPLVTKAQLSYKFHRPAYSYGGGNDDAGYLTTTIELQSGQPSILVEDGTNMDLYYRMNVYDGLKPDVGRYVSIVPSPDVRSGYEYDASNNKVPYGLYSWHKGDAYVDLTYDYSRYSSSASPISYPYLTMHNPWGEPGTGPYWQIYNSTAGKNGNLIGIFSNKASRSLGYSGTATGVGLYTSYHLDSNNQKIPEAGFGFSYLRDKGTYVVDEGRHSWGIFVGTKGADLSDTKRIQNIRRQQNLHGGISLKKIVDYKVDYYDDKKAEFENSPPFQEVSDLSYLLNLLQSSTPVSDPELVYLRSLLYGTTPDPVSQKLPIPNFVNNLGQSYVRWLDTASGESTQTYTGDMLNSLIHLDGVHNLDRYTIYHGIGPMVNKALHGNLLIALNKVTPEQAKQIKRFMVLFAGIANDVDYTGVGIMGAINGTENQNYMTNYFSKELALLLPDHPEFKDRTSSMIADAAKDMSNAVNESGAISSSTGNYIAATIPPFLDIGQLLKSQGRLDSFFDLDEEERLAKSGSFLLNLLVSDVRRGKTPATTVFGGLSSPGILGYGTKGIMPFGNSIPFTTEELFGFYGTLFHGVDDELSEQLMWAWAASGSLTVSPLSKTLPSNSFLQINPDLPQSAPKLGNADLSGYYTVLRNSFDTPQETACFMINGTHYRDHAQPDQGSITCHALGFPLSRDFAGYYHSGEVRFHSLAYTEPLPSSLHPGLPVDWAAGDPMEHVPLGYRPNWPKPIDKTFLSFSQSGYVSGIFDEPPRSTPQGISGLDVPEWTRELISIHPNENWPIILVRDSFSGGAPFYQNQSSVVSFNFMAEPQTPVQVYRPGVSSYAYPAPEFRISDFSNSLQGPSAQAPIDLPVGISRLGFTGQKFHLSENDSGNFGIDWDTYVLNTTTKPLQMLVGDWGFDCWKPFPLQKRAFDEYQYILRLRGQGPFTTLLLPQPKGQRPADRNVTYSNGKLTVVQAGTTTVIDDSSYGYQDTGKSILTTFDEQTKSYSGISIQGGSSEVVVSGKTATVTLHGDSGTRTIVLPGAGWTSNTLTKNQSGSFSIPYQGGEATTYTLTR